MSEAWRLGREACRCGAAERPCGRGPGVGCAAGWARVVQRRGPARAAAVRRRLPSRVRHALTRRRWRVQGAIAPPGRDRLPRPCPLDGREHCHEKYRVVCVTGGGAVLEVEGERFVLRAGDVLALAPGRVHALHPRSGHVLSQVTLDFVPGATLSPSEHALLARTFLGEPVIRCPRAAAREAQRLVHVIRAERRHSRAAGPVAAHAYLVALLVLLYRRRQHDPQGRAATDLFVEPALLQARQWLEERFAEPVRLSELADRAHLSVRQFTARFKRAFGLTPMQYLTKLRVAAAQDLLWRSDRGVAAIAREVGYENLSHFYRTFVQHTGMPPGRFRHTGPEAPP